MGAQAAVETGLDLLENPIWSGLSTTQTILAEGDGLARRFPPDVTLLAGLAEETAVACAALSTLLGQGEMAALFLREVPKLPVGVAMVQTGRVAQMVWSEDGELALGAEPELLGASSIPEALALTKLTNPGPFGPRTFELGSYYGIRVDGKLAAMAGERLRMPGFTEVSAVCTHPDWRGRGYASVLISAVIRGITRRGDVPFLHTFADNTGAISVYEKLGFKTTRVFTLAVLKNELADGESMSGEVHNHVHSQ